MFYYPAVLQRHTGSFSTIWLVATKGIRVPRRDFLKVNVISTCDDIMNYILEQVPPPRPGLPRPRFSLYLSSQLQYGVIVVYHRQCVIFLEELQSVLGQLLKQRTSQKIDMDDQGRPPLDLPDALSLLEGTEGALDPLFGVMYMGDTMPSPATRIQMDEQSLREVTPPAAAVKSDITASPETITLRETEPVTIPVPEFEGVELVDQHPDTMDFLLAQTDDFLEGDLEIPRQEVTPGDEEREVERGGREGDLEQERMRDLTGLTDLQPTIPSSEDAISLLQEEPGLSLEKPKPPADRLTPVSVPIPPSPPPVHRERPAAKLEVAPPPEVRRRRKRQLIFFDTETQLSQKVLQQQIADPWIETRPPLLPLPPSHRMVPAAELLNRPCNFLPEEVQLLWRRAAIIRPLSGLDLQVAERGPESTDSEREREREMVEAAREEEERLEPSPKEVPRDVAEPEVFHISDHGSLPLEGSDQRERSRETSPAYASEKEGSVVSGLALEDIPEMVEGAAAESPGRLPELAEHEVAPVHFQSLLPPEVDRRTVSNIFQRLLEIASARKVQVEQNEPYGDILIWPGPDYEEMLLSV